MLTWINYRKTAKKGGILSDLRSPEHRCGRKMLSKYSLVGKLCVFERKILKELTILFFSCVKAALWQKRFDEICDEPVPLDCGVYAVYEIVKVKIGFLKIHHDAVFVFFRVFLQKIGKSP